MALGAKVVLFSDVACTGSSRDALYMPLSLLAVGSTLKVKHIEVVIIDGQVARDWRVQLEHEIADACYLGVSALTGPSIQPAMEAIAIARRSRAELPIVWGGYHATLAYRSILLEGLADFVVLGPGEHAAVHLTDVLAEKSSSPPRERNVSCPNVAQLHAGEVKLDRAARRPAQWRELPPPLDYELINVQAYFEVRPRTLHYVSSYGCPHACTFCAEPEHSGRIWQALPPERVADELLSLWRRYEPDRIGIMDPNFSSSPRRVLAIAELLRRAGFPLDICCDMRATDVLRLAQLVDLRKLRDAGFTEIYIGLETGSDRQLQRLRKSLTADEAFEACRLLASAGIRTITSFMHDLPGETIEDSDATIALVRRLAALPGNAQRHHFFMPYPGTEAFRVLGFANGNADQTTQADWAKTSTYCSSELWRGRFHFRNTCLERLADIRASLDDPLRLTLPSLAATARPDYEPRNV
jgi:anaerobic magnesium-protoporphyrin IX monomethyl ester cyclase